MLLRAYAEKQVLLLLHCNGAILQPMYSLQGS